MLRQVVHVERDCRAENLTKTFHTLAAYVLFAVAVTGLHKTGITGAEAAGKKADRATYTEPDQSGQRVQKGLAATQGV